MNRIAASNKLVEGHNFYELRKIVDTMKSHPFRINVDKWASFQHSCKLL